MKVILNFGELIEKLTFGKQLVIVYFEIRGWTAAGRGRKRHAEGSYNREHIPDIGTLFAAVSALLFFTDVRSEERRVGKECYS